MTTASGVVRLGLATIGLVLVGAFLFGLWHVVVGGLVHGNPRAATFGFVLATTTGLLLAVGVVVIRRAGRGRRAPRA